MQLVGGKSKQLTASQLVEFNVNNYKPFNDDNGFVLPNIEFYYFTGTSSKNLKINKNSLGYDELVWKSHKSTDELSVETIDTNFTSTTYSLGENGTDETGMLIALLSLVTESTQTIYNTSWESESDWYSATWTTAVNDFKTRKFHCTEITYNETTGYVDSITFVEHVSSEADDTSKCDTYCYDW